MAGIDPARLILMSAVFTEN